MDGWPTALAPLVAIRQSYRAENTVPAVGCDFLACRGDSRLVHGSVARRSLYMWRRCSKTLLPVLRGVLRLIVVLYIHTCNGSCGRASCGAKHENCNTSTFDAVLMEEDDPYGLFFAE